MTPTCAPPIDATKVAIKYATEVISGKIVAGKLVKLACARFIRDLKTGTSRGVIFNDESKRKAQRVVDFIGNLKQFRGEWGKGGGQPIILAPWQVFVIVNLFGFLRPDGTRRFREAHIEIARKNGKTTLMAGIALYMLVGDDEPGAEVYCIATKKDQAREVFDAAVSMRGKSPSLREKIQTAGGVKPSNMYILETGSKFELQASDYGTADGKNVHCLIADELHQHPTRLLWDAYAEAIVARSQPLLIAITTAGYDQHGICYAQRNKAVNILAGNVDAVDGDHVFAFIACLDEEELGKDGKVTKPADDHFDEANWPKANPNLNVSVKLDALREKARNARMDTTALNTFLCKHMNVWTSQEIRWMDPLKWARCNKLGNAVSSLEQRKAAMERLLGRPCIGAFDLSSNNDLTAFVLLFPPCKEHKEKGEPIPQTLEDIRYRRPIQYAEKVVRAADPYWSVIPFFWVPEGRVDERTKKDRIPYRQWVKDGILLTTPGNTIKHEFLFDFVVKLKEKYDIKEIGFDTWNAQWIAEKLKEVGFTVEPVRPGFITMNEPMKDLMAKVLEGELEHFGNPILAWNAGNVAATQDPAGNIKPDKEASKEKIDGVVALIMAFARVCAKPELGEPVDSVYSSRGIVFL